MALLLLGIPSHCYCDYRTCWFAIRRCQNRSSQIGSARLDLMSLIPPNAIFGDWTSPIASFSRCPISRDFAVLSWWRSQNSIEQTSTVRSDPPGISMQRHLATRWLPPGGRNWHWRDCLWSNVGSCGLSSQAARYFWKSTALAGWRGEGTYAFLVCL